MKGINSVTMSTGELDDDDGNSFVVKGMNSVAMTTDKLYGDDEKSSRSR